MCLSQCTQVTVIMQAVMCADDVGSLDSTLIPVRVDGHTTAFRSVTTLSLVELGKKLLECAKQGDTEQVRLLMSKGAPFTTDWLGISPLHYAAQYGHVETADVLLRAGISRDARTKVERTPLHIAAQEGNTPVAELLLSSGAEVDSRDMLKMTPLHWAVEREHIETIVVLLQHGADPTCISKFDKNAFSIAIDNCREDILKILESAGHEEEATAEVSSSPLVLDHATLAATHSLAMELTQAPVAAHQEEVVTSSVPALDIPTKETAKPSVEKVFISSAPKSDRKPASTKKLVRDIHGQQTLQLLQAHGITMLPADESTLVASAMESGQTVVLTEAGKLALGLSQAPTLKTPPTPTATVSSQLSPHNLGSPKKKVITIRAGPVLVSGNKTSHMLKRPTQVERIGTGPSKVFLRTTPKNTLTVTSPVRAKSITSTITASASDLAEQLEAARREVQAYKELLSRKEREAEQYKLQLQSMTQSK